MSLHNEFYDFRDKVWAELEDCVHTGCGIIGTFPIIIGELNLESNEYRGGVFMADTTDLIINGIIKDESYSIFPKKESEHDIVVKTNKIKVIVVNYQKNINEIQEVEPDILDLQCLSTYLSGGFKVYG